MELLCRKCMNGSPFLLKVLRISAVMLKRGFFQGKSSEPSNCVDSASCFSTHNLKSVVTSVTFTLLYGISINVSSICLQNTTSHFHVSCPSHKLQRTSTDPRSSKLHRRGDKNKHVVDVVKRPQLVQVQATKPLGQIEENIMVWVKTRGLLDVMLHYAVRQVVYAKRCTYVNVLVLRGSQTPASSVSYFCVTHPSSPAPPQLGRSLYTAPDIFMVVLTLTSI